MTDWERLLDSRALRAELGVSQSELADLLGVSTRTIQACEQGWRQPSASLEKALLLLLIGHRNGTTFGKTLCWKALGCPKETRANCLAYRSRQGHLCWLVSGNLCHGQPVRSWSDKKIVCGQCRFFRELVAD